jgi:hypothetical protein
VYPSLSILRPSSPEVCVLLLCFVLERRHSSYVKQSADSSHFTRLAEATTKKSSPRRINIKLATLAAVNCRGDNIAHFSSNGIQSNNSRQADYRAMPFSCAIMAVLLLFTLTIASPTTSLEATASRHLKRQVATTTSLILPSIPTITIDILQPPYVSLHSITARDAQAPEPTTTTTSLLEATVPVFTVTLKGHQEPKLIAYHVQTTNVSSALHHWTEVPVASSAGCYTRVTNSTLREWDCTAICGALNEEGECSEVSGCVGMGGGKGKGGRPGLSSSAGSVLSSGHIGERVVAVMVLVTGAGMLLWL